MKVGIMQPYFSPYFGYFQLIGAVDTYVNLDHVSFMKRSYMTRNRIKDETPINIPVYEGSQNKKCSEIFVNFESQYLDKFKKKKEVLSPEMNIKTSPKIKIIKQKIYSYLRLVFKINKAKNKGNNLDKYDPKINSSPKKDERRNPVLGRPIILIPVKN